MQKSTCKKDGKMRIQCGTILAAALAAASPLALSGETDVYGNEIFTYTEGGVQKTYRFWVSGDKVEDATLGSSSALPSSGASFATGALTKPSAETLPIEARFRTWMYSPGTDIDSTKFCGSILIVF